MTLIRVENEINLKQFDADKRWQLICEQPNLFANDRSDKAVASAVDCAQIITI